MGGHGALTLHLKNPDTYKSVSAFSPVVAPAQVPWGEKAFTAYLGADREAWKQYDATELVKNRSSKAHILIDQATLISFWKNSSNRNFSKLRANKQASPSSLRRQPGYDHSYYFIASFMEDHLRHHADALTAS